MGNQMGEGIFYIVGMTEGGGNSFRLQMVKLSPKAIHQGHTSIEKRKYEDTRKTCEKSNRKRHGSKVIWMIAEKIDRLILSQQFLWIPG